MNLPNKLTILRIVLVPFFVLFLLCPGIPHRFLLAALLFGAASYTDHLDGKLARKNGQITNFGKFMDPLADKIMVLSALICFVALGIAPAWMVILIAAREFMVTSIRLVAADTGVVIAANNWGKAKTVSQIVAILVACVLEYIEELAEMQCIFLSSTAKEVFFWVQWSVLLIAVILSVISGMIYLVQNRAVIDQVR